jgi:putative transposase
VHQTGKVPNVLVQSQRDWRAANHLLYQLLQWQCQACRVMITDKLPSYGAPEREVTLDVEYCRHKGLNNRVSTRTSRRDHESAGVN